MIPRPRNLHFDLPPRHAGDWNAGGSHVSHFFNALSLLFPNGERFFIDSVRQYRSAADGTPLARAVSGFIGQEAMHGREHSRYNRLLDRRGLPAQALESGIARLLAAQRAMTPAAWQLSVTIALEHFTAILADRLLGDPRLLANAEPQFGALWRWHALEETEHKAVAYDVWNKALGAGTGAYLLRCTGMLATAVAFGAATAVCTVALIEADPAARRDLRGYRRLAGFLFGQPGLVRQGVRPWLAYFGRSFHPWDHDNRGLLGTARTAPMLRAA